MKNIFLSLFCLFLMGSCTSYEVNDIESEKISKFTIIMPQFQTDGIHSRSDITMGEYPNISSKWADGDSIGIFPSIGDQLSFRITASGDGKSCAFDGGGWALKPSSFYTAYSPFKRSYYYQDKDELLVSMLNQKQIGNNSTQHLGAYDIKIATGTKPADGGISFAMERKVALVRMDLIAPTAATWSSITLESDALFTTEATMDLSSSTPTLTPMTTSNTISLGLSGVTTTSENKNIIAYMMLLPINLTNKSLIAKITDSEGNTYQTKASIVNNRTDFTANGARWINADFEKIPYVTFSADEEQTLTMSKAVATLEYSVNGGEWKELGTNTVEFGGNLGNLKIRGKNIYGTSSYGPNTTIYNSPNVQFKNNALVACSGDIRTLIDYENYSTINTSNASFCGLFYGCKTLVSAPQLPIINLAKQCYQGMFYGCNSLKFAPELPAMTLTAQCYESMFSGCSSLTTAPKLPATILAAQCYTSMFSNCKSLTSAPELLVCNLHIDCYAYMFSGCSNLISPPQLPATKLVESCYFGMFSDCINLTTPPKLPAMTLAKSCYNSMFSGCSNLTSTPELLATTLTDNCYDSMFKNCSNLTTPPKLPAMTLAKSCYNSMFSGCSNLTSTPELLATTLTDNCYASMFKDCRSLSSAPDLPAETLTKGCYSSMFSGCSNLMTAPILSAKTLSSETEVCYAGMFENCSKLENITMLATQIYDMLCFYNWISGVSSKGTFTKAKEIESLPVGGVIPEGWTIKNYGEE